MTIGALLGLLPLPALASSAEIYRWSSQSNIVTLRVRVVDDENVPIEGLSSQEFEIHTTDKRGNPIAPSEVKFVLVPPSQSQNPETAYIVVLLDKREYEKSRFRRWR